MTSRLWALAAWCVLLPAACADHGAGEARETPALAIPTDAIKFGDELYMLPLAAKVGDCPAFRPWSPTKMVAQAIYYRGRAGGFVMDRAQAAC
jgi:hypothetical protein